MNLTHPSNIFGLAILAALCILDTFIPIGAIIIIALTKEDPEKRKRACRNWGGCLITSIILNLGCVLILGGFTLLLTLLGLPTE